MFQRGTIPRLHTPKTEQGIIAKIFCNVVLRLENVVKNASCHEQFVYQTRTISISFVGPKNPNPTMFTATSRRLCTTVHGHLQYGLLVQSACRRWYPDTCLSNQVAFAFDTRESFDVFASGVLLRPRKTSTPAPPLQWLSAVNGISPCKHKKF